MVNEKGSRALISVVAPRIETYRAYSLTLFTIAVGLY